ncbi:MAG: hypothetical protein ACFFD2_02245 [Promethearchaeota archaeon]
MQFNKKNIREIIQARLSRTQIYLQRYLQELPKYLTNLRHKFEHPLSELHVIVQQLSPRLKPDNAPLYFLPEGGIPEDIDYLELALNEIKTSLLYFKLRKTNEIFEGIRDYYLEQKLSGIIQQLETLKDLIK